MDKNATVNVVKYQAIGISILLGGLGVAIIRGQMASAEQVQYLLEQRAALQIEQNHVWRERLDMMAESLRDAKGRLAVAEARINNLMGASNGRGNSGSSDRD